MAAPLLQLLELPELRSLLLAPLDARSLLCFRGVSRGSCWWFTECVQETVASFPRLAALLVAMAPSAAPAPLQRQLMHGWRQYLGS